MASTSEIYTRFSSSSDNYYNIEDILASQEKVPVKTELPLYNLGFLNPSSDSEHILPGSKMELPFWLATGLCSRKRKIVSVELPKAYRVGYREIFTADPNVVDLHKTGPYFYSFGTKLLCFESNESDDISRSLLQTFVGRFRRIMDNSQNALNEDITKLMAKLDEMERSLFRAGQKSLMAFQEWETRKMTKLAASGMVTSHRKRKRAMMEEGD
ncbi:DNA replication complex GINS protein PSF3-like [Acanthaster planci]|uniref:DNA replication complex GINS protein PSF3 n=1 Tax=Acanthaster planci TaxID=133434 RepID=A0A8B7XNH0_ACAPL|nr:DNA replication complex GINS protein PSF3-like [Acanthaster planci]